ncbi:MAG: hypothetical protein KAJ95_03690 [Gammaproteobacteria bacterium]|nr:hypothetical protein [Gammaproteobacteria bacterium]
MDLPEIFASPETLRAAFENGLDRLLDDEAPGPFILVLANSLFDEKIFNKFKHRLAEKFDQVKQDYSIRLGQGKQLTGAADDILVLLKLIAMGFESLSTTEYRQTENWALQFNQLRSLRPKRMSGETISSLLQDFDEMAFHFNKSFLDKEVFWSGDIAGTRLKLLYNKFPFATLHGLLVPEPEKNHPQFLKPDMHNYIRSLCRQLGENIANIGLAYNAYGAGASINHLHFQTFCMQYPLPLLHDHWRHNGGSTPYPVSCKVFENNDRSWAYINNLHQNNIAYNIIYLPEIIIILPRQFQGNYNIPDWTENFAWNELCGGITTFNQDDFHGLEDEIITSALSALNLSNF